MSTRKKKAGKATRNSIPGSIAGSAVSQLQGKLDRADALIGQVADLATDTIGTLRKQAGALIQGLRASLDGVAAGSFGDVKETAQSAISYARKHPWHTAAVAVGVGVTAAAMREGSRRLH